MYQVITENRKKQFILNYCARSWCFVAAGQKNSAKPLEGRTIYLDLVGRKNYVGFEKKLRLLGAVQANNL